MIRCLAERISVFPTSCDSAHSKNQRAPLRFFPQLGVNRFIFSLSHNRLTFPFKYHEVPKLEFGISRQRITDDRFKTAPEKRPNSFDHPPRACVDIYSTY